MSPFNPKSWFNRRSPKDSPDATAKEDQQQTFILEPIYTPSGFTDVGDDPDAGDLSPIDDPMDDVSANGESDVPGDDGDNIGDDGENIEGDTEDIISEGEEDVGDVDNEPISDEEIGETIPYAEDEEDSTQAQDSGEDGEASLGGDADIPDDGGETNDEELTDNESPDSEETPEGDDINNDVENELEENPEDDTDNDQAENELEENPEDDTDNDQAENELEENPEDDTDNDQAENENEVEDNPEDDTENLSDAENSKEAGEETADVDNSEEGDSETDNEAKDDLEDDDDDNPLAFDVPEFNSGGIFQVGNSGEVGVDFLFDGGRYQGEVAFFSLAGFDELEFNSIEDFIAEAAQRAASGSEQGHIVIRVADEGARFTGSLFGEPNWNTGVYEGVKTFNMTPGDEFGVMLVPNGRVSDVLDNPSLGGAKRPLFSLAPSNPQEGFHLGQIADLTGDGNTFVFEDKRVEVSDWDYDDVIFQIRGAVGNAVHVDDVIDPDLDWRHDDLGKALLAYSKPYLATHEQLDLAELVAQDSDGLLDGDDGLSSPDSDNSDSEGEELEDADADLDEVDEADALDEADDGDSQESPSDSLDEDEAVESSGESSSTSGESSSNSTSNPDSSSTSGGSETVSETQPSSEESQVTSVDNSAETVTEEEASEGSESSQEVSEAQPEVGSEEPVSDNPVSETEVDESSEETAPSQGTDPLVTAAKGFELAKEDQPLVGVIDTGFAENNPDLNYDNVILGRDWVDGDDNPLLAPGEGSEHGTHLLGLIAAGVDNDLGIDGINPEAPVWLGRGVGSGEWASSLVEFVDAAAESGQANAVVNLSLDLTEIDAEGNVSPRYELTVAERTAIEYARQQGVLLVVAAGNDGSNLSGLAQASREFDNVLTVGAAEAFDPNLAVAEGHSRAEYSNFGTGLGLLAPGGTAENPVLSTVGDDLGTLAGTSVATARVTGATSLVWAANPELSYRQVIEILQSTATDLESPNWDGETGAGLLNLLAAVHLAKATQPQAYDPTPIEIGETPRRRHLVQPGETPAGLAEAELGDEEAWVEITDSEGNPFEGPDEPLVPGTVVELPMYGGGVVNPQVESPAREPQPLTPGNQEPEDLQVSLSRLYNPGETIRLSGWVSDADGAEDLERVEFWLRQDSGDWVEIGETSEFAIDPNHPDWGGFEQELSGLTPGQYELRAIPHDQSGEVGQPVSQSFTVLSVSEEQHLSERVKRAITQAMNLEAYHPEILALTEQWVVSVKQGESPEALAQQLGGTVLEPTGHIPNTYVWKFDGDNDPYEIAAAMERVREIEFAYPLVDLPIDLHSTPWHLENSGQTGGQPGVDARVKLAWDNHGVSGQGTTIGVLDTGFDYNHPNLRDNYQAHLSYDFDEDNHDPSHLLSATAGYSSSAWIDAGETLELKLDDDARLRNASFNGYISKVALNLNGLNLFDDSQLEDVEIALVSPTRQEFVLTELESGSKTYSTNIFNGERPNILNPDDPWKLKVTNNSSDDMILERDISIDFELVNTHGTQVAGAAVASSGSGGQGVAQGADWAGLRLGSDGFTELEITKALSHEKQEIDIYNNSWGTTFRNMALPGAVWTLENSVESGRDGLGNAFVFSAGNSRQKHDNVNYNPLANSRHTLAVGAVDHVGNRAIYSTPGAPLFLSAPSGNTHGIFYEGSNQTIPDNGSSLSVELGEFEGLSATELINNLQIQLGINHTQYDDLEVSLVRVGEDGTETRAKLFSEVPFEQPYQVPGIIEKDGVVSFSDTSPRELPNHGALFQGTFRPEEPLDIFTQKEAGGTWRIEVQDRNQNNLDGSLTSAAVFLNTPGIATTDIQGEAGTSAGNWTNQFGGTSAAAPIVSGVVALMLEVNPNLTWRDIQHILVETANREAIHDENADWTGSSEDIIRHSHQYGFGLVDADAAVAAAKSWVSVEPETSLTVTDRPHIKNSRIRKNDPEGVSSSIEIEDDLTVEWVEIDFQGNHPKPQNLTLELVHTYTTAEGEEKSTVSKLASPYKPTGNHEHDDWWFTSVRHWGETSEGTWTLQVADEGGKSSSLDTRDGIWDGWTLTLHGTEPPQESEYPKPGYVNDRVGSLDLNMRQDPSIDNPVIGVLEKGANLTILEPVTGKSYEIPPYEGEFRSDWYKVQVGDQIAYVAAYYVSEDEVNKNVSPAPPTNLTSDINGDRVILNWDAPTDSQTLQKDLTYNLRIGTRSEGSDIMDHTQKKTGNIVANTSKTFDLPSGIYYWSVQTVENEFRISEFANEQSFVIQAEVTTKELITRFGESFQVNTQDIGDQRDSSVTGLSDGGFVVVWRTRDTDLENYGVYGQQYDKNGKPVGSEFTVSNSGSFPSVTKLSDGGFAVAWTERKELSGGIYLKQYDAFGNLVGSELQVNNVTGRSHVNRGHSHVKPSVSSLSHGGFLVTWYSLGILGSASDVLGQFYDEKLNKVGLNFIVNTHVENWQMRPSPAGLSNGESVIVWESLDQDGSGYGIYGQRYDRYGNPTGLEFQVNTQTEGDQRFPSVAGLSNGGFVVIWELDNNLYGKLYNSSGNVIGSDFLVSDHDFRKELANPSQSIRNVTSLPNGGFVVTWSTWADYGSHQYPKVYAKTYDNYGNIVDFQSIYENTNWVRPYSTSITNLSDEKVIITWVEEGQSKNIYGQVLDIRQ